VESPGGDEHHGLRASLHLRVCVCVCVCECANAYLCL
jgi:hypothetical protein